MEGGFWVIALSLGALLTSLRKLMASGGGTWFLALTLCWSTHLAISVRIFSCLHLYRPSPNAMGQPVKMWFSVQRVAPHCLQDRSSSFCQVFKLFGVGKRSATTHSGKVNLPRSVSQSSFQDSDCTVPLHPLYLGGEPYRFHTAVLFCCLVDPLLYTSSLDFGIGLAPPLGIVIFKP